MIAREVGEYLGVFDPSLAQAKKAAETLISAIARRQQGEFGSHRVPKIGWVG